MTAEPNQPLGLAALPGVALPASALASRRLTGTRAAGTAIAPTAAGPILKPLPPELFTVFGTNAETKWESLSGQGYHTPNDRFFVRNHTATPTI